MTTLTGAKQGVFRRRDLFVHDGSHLRRISLTAPVQAAMAVLLLFLVGWSAFATARMVTASPTAVPQASVSPEIARLAAATQERVARIEQRQQLIAAMLATDEIDPAMVRRLVASSSAEGAQGGPFEPVKGGDATFKQLFTSWKKLDNLADGAIAVPSEKPVRSAEFTSGYGVRSDPFKGRAAMHAGIDLAGPLGTPIYATADGVVSTAGYNSGGYGNLIKVDHGKGIETRYGHLSSMAVQAGQRVTRGQLIGRMGSTGRSTGSHLHYEVRIDGRAVNPIPFMKSNDYLLAMQQKGNASHSMDAVALGGPKR